MFFKSYVFLVTVLLQLAGPYFFGFGNWANIIQYVSGFGMAYAVWQYEVHHKKQIQRILRRLETK